MKLRTKFFLVLVGIPTVAVIVLLFVSIQVFVEDKKIFIFESQLDNAHLLARQILTEISSNPGSRSNIQKLEAFRSTNINEKILIDIQSDRLGQILATSMKIKDGSSQKVESYLSLSAIEKISDISANEASFEDQDTTGQPVMYSFIRIPEEKMILILQTPKTSAFRASLIFILKGVITLLGLVSMSTVASLLLAKSMTKNVTKLEASMKSFGSGNLDAKANIVGNDEIGKLGNYFNNMVRQINNLMSEQQEKIKLQFEMEMASKLQAQFFPNKDYSSEEIDFSGFYQSSSQCGGDWWYYFIKNDLFISFMGDVTGHGVRSALMTSASRSIFALIEENFTDTKESMNILNRSFFSTAIGEVNMSAIMMSVNIKTGELEYTNASHDPPMLFTPYKKSNSEVQYALFDESHGMRLGFSKNTTYKSTKLQLDPGSVIFVYTDGLLEIQNKNGRSFSDRTIIKTIKELCTEGNKPVAHMQSDFQERIIQYSQGLSNLNDDLSYFFVRYSGTQDQALRRHSDVS